MVPHPPPIMEYYEKCCIEGMARTKGKRVNFAEQSRQLVHRYAKGDVVYIRGVFPGASSGPYYVVELTPSLAFMGPPQYILQADLRKNAEWIQVAEMLIHKKDDMGNPIP